jgi:hypothetical protein
LIIGGNRYSITGLLYYNNTPDISVQLNNTFIDVYGNGSQAWILEVSSGGNLSGG